jgi:hypothetical protein
LDGGVVLEDLVYPLASLLDGEHGLFGGVDADADDEFIEEGDGAFDNIHMTFGDGVECSGK